MKLHGAPEVSSSFKPCPGTGRRCWIPAQKPCRNDGYGNLSASQKLSRMALMVSHVGRAWYFHAHQAHPTHKKLVGRVFGAVAQSMHTRKHPGGEKNPHFVSLFLFFAP